MIRLSIFVMLLLGHVYGVAQEVQGLTLEQVLALAEKQNVNVKIAQLDAESAALKRKEVKVAFMPQFNGLATVNHFLEQNQLFLPGEILGMPGKSQQIDAGLPSSATLSIENTHILYNQSLIEGLKSLKLLKGLNELNIEKA